VIDNISELAIFNGKPKFNAQLHVGCPNIGSREQLFDRMNIILDRKWLTNYGPFVQQLEQKICEHLNVKHCIAMCNATVALEIAIRALELKGEVIIPSFTFIASAHALQWQEITPVFCDIDPQTHMIDPEIIQSMITPKTTGIMGVHLWGRPCNIDAIVKVAKKNNLRILFDAAHAFYVSYKGKMIGNFGDAEVLSFHATKFFNTFEGGAVVTNDDMLAEKIRLMKNFGFTGFDKVIYTGTNGKMSEASAAMGLTNLESIDDFISSNYSNYKLYQKELSGCPGLQLIGYNEKEKNNFHYIIIEIDEHTIGINRDDVISILHAENILARRYFYPGCHNMEPYRSYNPHAKLLLPETERLAQKVIALPTGISISSSEIEIICKVLRNVVENGREINNLLKHKQYSQIG